MTATQHLDELAVAELLGRHVARLDYRGDFAGRCGCGEPIEGGYPGHVAHVAKLVVGVMTPEPAELAEIRGTGPTWFVLPDGGVVDLDKAYLIDAGHTPAGYHAVVARFLGADDVTLSDRLDSRETALEQLGVLRQALG